MTGFANCITTVSFDADGTLFDFGQVVRHSLRQVLAELRRRVPSVPDWLTVEQIIAIRYRVGEELRGRVTNLEEVRLAAFRRTLEAIGVADDALAADLNEAYLGHRFEGIELYDDVIPTLDGLRGRFGLGVISNGDSYPERCGLEGRFEFAVFSQDHGVEKPDPRLFRAALEEAGCQPEELLHVGDSLEADVAGAQAAGARAAWLNRGGWSNHTDLEPDLEIRSLSALLEALGGEA